jgi:hypothetical protein
MRSRALATMLTVLLLTACSGGGEEPEASPEGSSAGAGTPTEAEYAEAHELYHDLADVLDQAGDAAATFQATVKKAHDKDPEGFRDSPAVAAAVEEQEAAVATREAALTELAEHPAMADEELAAAYEKFRTGYAEAIAYQDGYNDSYPAFLTSGDVCTRVFESGPEDAPSFTAYAREWLRLQEKASAPCLEATDELAGSGNEDVVAVADRWGQLIDERTAAIRRMSQGKLSSDKTLSAVKKANNAFIEDYDRLTDFSKRLGELYPIDEYDAIDPIFEDRLGASADPSDGPSDDTSDDTE